MNDHAPDAAVVARVLSGDVESFGILVNRYRDRYFRIAWRLLGNREDAEDALQDAFVRAYRSLRKCADPSRFGAWLYAILINQCRTAGAKRGSLEKRITGTDVLDGLADSSTARNAAEEREEVERALARLSHDQREAFLLKYVEELSYEEMSEITGDNVSALKMRVKRACDGLRNELERVEL